MGMGDIAKIGMSMGIGIGIGRTHPISVLSMSALNPSHTRPI